MAFLFSQSCSFFSLLFLLSLQCQKAYSSFHHHHNHHKHVHYKKPILQAKNHSTCSLFVGTWVHDESYPFYQSSSCEIIDPEFNCQRNGRPDSDYLKYRWKPLNCELPRFNGVEFLVKMKGKNVMFVGDSLGRNQWQSLICMLSAATPHGQTQLVGGDPLSTFTFLDYGVKISFYRTPFLVEVDVVQGKRILRLEKVGKNGDTWKSAHVLLFNTGHWWTHQGSLQGWDYVELGGKYYHDIDRLVALERGMKTWANWVDTNIDRSRTHVLFQAISPTHYNKSEWNAAGGRTTSVMTTKNCYGETSPISGRTTNFGEETYTHQQMRVVDMVIREMRDPAYLLGITKLSALRKDAHPSIYSGELSPLQRANHYHSADCSHWCLPGLPDTWNQLLYVALFY
ncbi:protein PMR5-like [Cicer arietinum]|uniref:Protein PMR5-like n=1 Tax=Cicer arietinum TaxID=3827 RepID=A0A1S2XK76_CICAR|nr:protein PMR5-like [Cicer arietinum]